MRSSVWAWRLRSHYAPSGRLDLGRDSTAGEFMAALALSLCEWRRRGWRSSDRNTSETSVPTTNTPEAIGALMAGLEPSPHGFSSADRIRIRVRGELRAVEVRTHLMERLLPVPDEVAPVHKIVSSAGGTAISCQRSAGISRVRSTNRSVSPIPFSGSGSWIASKMSWYSDLKKRRPILMSKDSDASAGRRYFVF